jgi:hypothetical protein
MIRRAMLPLTVAILIALCFLPALSGSFLNWDDNVNFLGNSAYRGLGPEQVRWAFTSVLFGHYIPLTRLTWSLNYALGGMDPWGYHLVNVLLHGVNAAIFYVVARRLLVVAVAARSPHPPPTADLSTATAFATLAFGVHPLRVEPVAWISARPDLLCATFALLATWAYLRAVEGDGPAWRGLILVSAVALAGALLSKGVALPLVVGLLLLDVYPLRRVSRLGWRRLAMEKIPLLLVTAAGAGLVVSAVRQGAVLTLRSEYGVAARLTAMGYSFLISPMRFVWPASLSPLHEMPARISLLDPRFGPAVAGTVLVTATLLVLRRRWPAGLAAWTFSAIMLAPTSAVVRQGAELAPDRYSYLSGLGFAVLAGGAVLGVMRLVRRGTLGRPIGWAMACAGSVAIAGLATTSWAYGLVWRDSETLWRWAVEVNPACSVCHDKLGESVLTGPGGATRIAEAEALFRRAIALRPDLPDAYFNLGTALVIEGSYTEAEGPLRGFMERAPASTSGPARLGLVYLLQHRYEAAIPLLRTALIRSPEAPSLRGYLAQALQGRARELEATGQSAQADALRVEATVLGGANDTGPSTQP